MELTVLGSGTSIPHPDRGAAGCLLRGGDRMLLVDLGPGALRTLAALGISPADPDAVAFTHLHLDHTAELAPLLFALRNPGRGRSKPLLLLGGPGFREFYARLRQMYGAWVEPFSYPLEIEEIDHRPVSLGGIWLRAYPVRHTPQSVAFRVEEPGAAKTLAFSGDSDRCEGLVEAARGADLAVFECSFPDGHKVEGHLTPGEAGEIASRAGVKRLLLTHFYPECEGEDLVSQCRKNYGGEILLAEDRLRIPV
ncbi:MAG: MBL fold metallo-hydrolase [Deltaproteobacteria bacterium]